MEAMCALPPAAPASADGGASATANGAPGACAVLVLAASTPAGFCQNVDDAVAPLPCAALFGLDAFPHLDEFINSADFDGACGARRAARAARRRWWVHMPAWCSARP